MIDTMLNINHNCAASLGFERSSYAVNGENVVARISWGSVFRKAKVVLTNPFRLAGQFNRISTNSGFFTPIDAVTTTLDSLLKSAGCGVKIGFTLAGLLPSHRSYTECTSLSRQATHCLTSNVTVKRILGISLDEVLGKG